MSELFNDLKPKEKKIPDNIQINKSMFSDLMPSEDKHQYKITEEGNRGTNLTNEDKIEPGLFDDLKPTNTEEDREDIDGDKDLWDKIAFATKLGFTDTYRGVKQIANVGKEEMKKDQEKLYQYMENQNFTQQNIYFFCTKNTIFHQLF